MSLKSNFAFKYHTFVSPYKNPIVYDPAYDKDFYPGCDEKLAPTLGCWVCLKCGHNFYGGNGLTLHKGDIPDSSVPGVAKCILSRMHPDPEVRAYNEKQGFLSKDLVFVMGLNLDLNWYLDTYPFPRDTVLALRDIAKENFKLGYCDKVALEVEGQENTWV